ncbi:MAG: ROK family protein [Candidatus Omnitrophica bacterium]|nr:ROK family protein [Candidatus Omnitrophota bacterium]
MKDRYYIGIDLGGTNLKIALFDSTCRIIGRQVLPTEIFAQPKSLITAIVSSVNAIMAGRRLNTSAILGIGIGLPGPVDVTQGVVHFFPNIPGWKEVPLRSILEEKLGLPVFVDNDANLMCLAEYKAGAARGSTNAVCLTLGTGVGGGLIIDGRLFRGSSFAAGEIGHVPINEHGPACNCGGVACLESYIGNRRIAHRVRMIFKKDIPLEDLSRMARRGNAKAAAIWKDVGRKLGVALVGVVNLLNPDRIVIGGGVANAGSVLFDAVSETILMQAMVVQAKKVRVTKAQLGSDAGMIGAAFLVKEETDKRKTAR